MFISIHTILTVISIHVLLTYKIDIDFKAAGGQNM